MKYSLGTLSRRLGVTVNSKYPCLMMVVSRLSVCLKKILTHLPHPRRSCRRYAPLCVLRSVKILRDSITELQGLLHTLEKPQEAANALNSIHHIDDPTGHDIQLKLSLKTQAQLVYIFVKTVSGVIQGVITLDEKDNNYSKTFEMYLGYLNITH